MLVKAQKGGDGPPYEDEAATEAAGREETSEKSSLASKKSKSAPSHHPFVDMISEAIVTQKKLGSACWKQSDAEMNGKASTGASISGSQDPMHPVSFGFSPKYPEHSDS